MTPSTDGADGAGKRAKAETDYVVLAVNTNTDGDPGLGTTFYTEVGRVKARSNKLAAKAAATAEGDYIAVPVRNFETVPLKSELVVG